MTFKAWYIKRIMVRIVVPLGSWAEVIKGESGKRSVLKSIHSKTPGCPGLGSGFSFWGLSALNPIHYSPFSEGALENRLQASENWENPSTLRFMWAKK